ncbi:hypothetical protein Tco_0570008 [Tanacetum coccineum]|uniref:Uncharacterized protein n=1 Tax=Tanacetum coccineum TaxID=301880 RepID=A0ABQ4Y2Y7_9ASTR
MLGPGRYSQWRSRFLRYLDTKSNGEYLKKCIFEGNKTEDTTQGINNDNQSRAVWEIKDLDTMLGNAGSQSGLKTSVSQGEVDDVQTVNMVVPLQAEQVMGIETG